MVDSLTDPRAYLQKRVALFTGVTFVFFALLLALDFATPAEGEPLISSTRIASMVVLVTHGAVWAITRRGERSVALCRGLELLEQTLAQDVSQADERAVADASMGRLPLHVLISNLSMTDEMLALLLKTNSRQARVADKATVVSTSTRNFPNRLGKGADVFLASAELATVAAISATARLSARRPPNPTTGNGRMAEGAQEVSRGVGA